MDPDRDADDWARAVTGDGEAFARIFDRRRRQVRRQAARLLESPHDIEDAVAIVFLEAWRRRDAVRLVDGSLLPWLLVTAANVASNLRRGSRRYRALLDRLPPPDPGPGPDSSLDDSDLLAALRRLPLTDRQVLTLCVLESWPEREVAAVLQVRPGTVKSRLHRAKKHLKDQLGAPTQEEMSHEF